MRMWLIVAWSALVPMAAFGQEDEARWGGEIAASISGSFIAQESRVVRDLTLTIEPTEGEGLDHWLVREGEIYTVELDAERAQGGIARLAVHDGRRGLVAEARTEDATQDLSLRAWLIAPVTGRWFVDVRPSRIDELTWQVQAWILIVPEWELVERTETDTHVVTTFRLPAGFVGGSASDTFSFEGRGLPPDARAELWLEADPERRWELGADQKLDVGDLPEGAYLLRISVLKPFDEQ